MHADSSARRSVTREEVAGGPGTMSGGPSKVQRRVTSPPQYGRRFIEHSTRRPTAAAVQVYLMAMPFGHQNGSEATVVLVHMASTNGRDCKITVGYLK